MKIFKKQQFEHSIRQEKKSNSGISNVLMTLYRVQRLRKLIISICHKIEEGPFFSKTLRKILKKYHDVTVGPYSYGPCLTPTLLPPGSHVGAYCSFADGLQVFRRNHPGNTLSQHPFFYNAALGYVAKDTISLEQENPLVIGNDVWIGNRVTILPSCKHIGDGSIIGAGSVLTSDVEAFTMVAGNPARFIKRRYDADIEASVTESRWWDLPLPDLLKAQNLLVKGINSVAIDSFTESRTKQNH